LNHRGHREEETEKGREGDGENWRIAIFPFSPTPFLVSVSSVVNFFFSGSASRCTGDDKTLLTLSAIPAIMADVRLKPIIPTTGEEP